MAINSGGATEAAGVAPRRWLALAGLALLLAGAFLAQLIRTGDGVSVRDIRFVGTNGTVMSALLYVPKGATPATRAPGILAVHGYINSRETQDGFAIEFARRGYVVLSLDQTGHGYSGGAAFSNGFGGPDGLRYLRALPMVDPDQIGLEGHSMGGWTVLAAAAALPDGYRAVVLEGSSTGAPYAREGSPAWPRNLALVYSRYDEFAKLMWGADRARDVGNSAKLRAVFGTASPVTTGQLYGNIASGTARILYQPATTHPGDHISTVAIGHATDWFAATLKGGHPRPASDQIWYWKEFGTGLGLIGFVMLLLGSFDLLLRLPFFAPLQARGVAAVPARDRRWWRGLAVNSALPALLFFPCFIAIFLLVPPTALLPQMVTTQTAFWALTGAGISLLIARFSKNAPAATPQPAWPRALTLAVMTVASGYAALALVDALFHTDFRFWVIAVKLPDARQWGIAARYVVPITLAFLVTLKTLCHGLTVAGDSPRRSYVAALLTLTGGFIVLLGASYGLLFLTGSLLTGFDPLSTIIGLQFIPVLAVIAIIAIFTWRRTNSYRPGALIVGMLVTLYIVAGTATQV